MPPSRFKTTRCTKKETDIILFRAIIKLFMQRPTGLGKLLKEDDELDEERYKLQEAEFIDKVYHTL